MIVSFDDTPTQDLYHGISSRKTRQIPPDIQKVALRKLDMVNHAHELRDLRIPPGNRLEPLRGDLEGYHSIRVNDQWRIVFRWEGTNAYEVRLIDYH